MNNSTPKNSKKKPTRSNKRPRFWSRRMHALKLSLSKNREPEKRDHLPFPGSNPEIPHHRASPSEAEELKLKIKKYELDSVRNLNERLFDKPMDIFFTELLASEDI